MTYFNQDRIDYIVQKMIAYFDDRTPDYLWYTKTVTRMVEQQTFVEMCFYLQSVGVDCDDWDDFYVFLQLNVYS